MCCNCNNSCNSCGNARFQMPQFEIVSPCCFRPRGGIFLVRQVGCGRRNDQQDDRRQDDDRWDGCGCQRNCR